MRSFLFPLPPALQQVAGLEPHATAAGFAAAASQQFFQGNPADAVASLRAALHTAGILDPGETPATVGRALLEALEPQQRGTVLAMWCREKSRLLLGGESDESAGLRASAWLARELNMLEIAPRDFEGALCQSKWHLDSVLSPGSQRCIRGLAEVAGLDAANPEAIIELALLDLLRSLAPAHPALNAES
jgi:hypothetical protein